MRKEKILFGLMLLTLVILFMSGCLQNKPSQNDFLPKEEIISQSQTDSLSAETLSKEEIATQNCKTLCKDALKIKWDLSAGPCLSEATLSWDMQDWVCDVAHNPRIAADDLKENQCYEYGVSANHFVELDTECKFIKAI